MARRSYVTVAVFERSRVKLRALAAKAQLDMSGILDLILDHAVAEQGVTAAELGRVMQQGRVGRGRSPRDPHCRNRIGRLGGHARRAKPKEDSAYSDDASVIGAEPAAFIMAEALEDPRNPFFPNLWIDTADRQQLRQWWYATRGARGGVVVNRIS